MKYTARPIEVDAAVILEVSQQSHKGGSRLCALDDGTTHVASKAMLARFMPSAGDYWVTQEDGYQYINPKTVFERKYAPSLK